MTDAAANRIRSPGGRLDGGGLGAGDDGPSAGSADGVEWFRDNFTAPSDRWVPELERGGRVTIGGGAMDLDVPAAAAGRFKPVIEGARW